MSEVSESEDGRPAGALGLADFLADLRAELADAQQQAEGSSLKLGVEEVTVELEVAVTTARKGGTSGKLGARSGCSTPKSAAAGSAPRSEWAPSG